MRAIYNYTKQTCYKALDNSGNLVGLSLDKNELKNLSHYCKISKVTIDDKKRFNRELGIPILTN